MYEFLWFISGALLYKYISKLFKIFQLFSFFQEIQLQIIAMLIAASNDLNEASSIKHEMMVEADVPPEEIKNVELIDESILNSWRQASTIHMKNATPSYFQPLITFETWEEAINYYEQLVKK